MQLLFYGWLIVLVLWHINLCILFNAKTNFYANSQFYFKQFSLARVHSVIVKSIFTSTDSVNSNSSNSANSV